ncbi:hypothetical protein J2X73_004671 [Novosphingobium sp. 1748]|uniref:DUF7146 domain-containing protein n=1 Tax=Novosphingobium sp. 1748 TaxID=2817760 RepID=UPI0028658B5E|nr:toprim domain-containing protein [Novosphingobium sp. 1748]MDR6710266.1 hypothetical protein [Novosphingobium sp. 1748]
MVHTPETAARQIVQDLKGTWHRKHGMVRCPAHEDAHASLSVTPGRHAVLFHCFAGCTQGAIMAALRDLRLNPKIRARDPVEAAPHRDLTPLIKDLWGMARPVARTLAERYLNLRGIGHSCAGRFTPSAVTYEGGRKLRLPALLLPMTEGRELRALLRIFLDADGQKARCLDGAKRTLGDTRGSVIQLGAPADATMNLAEGFEDAESAMVLNDLPGCAAVCGVERYREITIPEHVRRIVIYSQHGKAAVDGIARGHDNLTANGRSLDIVLPPPGGDWNDALLARTAIRA